MAIIRTVLGDLEAAGFGVIDAHDHVLIGRSWGSHRDPDLLIDDVDEAAAELSAFAAAGGHAVVDAMPTSCGRDAEGLQRVAESSGVAIIATSGFHTSDYYPPWHWYHRVDQATLTEIVVAEVNDGIDSNDHLGPEVVRTAVRPGQLKAAVGYHAIGAAEERALRATADAQVETGLPLTIHVEHGADPLPALRIVIEHGVDAERVSLAHMDRNPDWPVHRRVLDTGAWLSYDGLYRERYRPDSIVIGLLAEALRDDARVLLGGDVARRSLRRVAGGTGIAGFAGAWRRRVLDEVGEGADRFFVRNPVQFLSLPAPQSAGLDHHRVRKQS